MKMFGFPKTPFYLDSSDNRKIPERGREMPAVDTILISPPIKLHSRKLNKGKNNLNIADLPSMGNCNNYFYALLI